MSQANEQQIQIARKYFRRAEEVASVGNYDYGIELYLEGVRIWPNSIEEAHAPLRKLGILRYDTGGKKPSLKDKLAGKGKEPIDQLIHAESLFAKDPFSTELTEKFIDAAVKCKLDELAIWLSKILLSELKPLDKKPFSTLIHLKDIFASFKLYQEAAMACKLAKEMKPGNFALEDELKELLANLTIQQGQYDTDENFRKAIKDREKQENVQQANATHKSESFKSKEVSELEDRLENTPDSQALRLEYAKKAARLGDQQLFEKACRQLDGWYRETKEFAYQKALGEVIIRDLKDKAHAIRTGGSPEDSRERYIQLRKKLSDVELHHFKGCAENYPTELQYVYELAVRYVKHRQYDEAIPLLQKAQRRPALKNNAMYMLGLCFFHKKWFTDAIEIFENMIEGAADKSSDIFKEVRYHLALAYEHEGNLQAAFDTFRKLAHEDFSYKDISKRIDALRTKI